MVNVNCMGGGGYFSDDVSAKRSQVVKGHSTITNDQNDEIVEGTMLDVTSDDRNVGRYVASNNLILGMTNGAHRTKNSTSGFPEVSIPLSDVASTIGATDASKILKGTTISGVAGTMPDNGAWSSSLGLSGSVVIPKGYHNGSGKITRPYTVFSGGVYTPGTQDQTIITKDRALTGNIICLGNANLKAENIKHGVKLFGITGSRNPSSYNAYTGSAFQGALRDGIINAPRNLPFYTGQFGGGIDDRWPNGAHWGNATDMGQKVTSGTLSATNPSQPFSDNYHYGPFFVSVNTIDFTKVSKIRVTGNFTAEIMADINGGLASIDMKMRLGEYTKNGSAYTMVVVTSYQSTDDIESRNTTESAFWYTGTVNYDFTFDVSSWTETSGILALFVNNNWYDTGGGGGRYRAQTIKINTIQFQP